MLKRCVPRLLKETTETYVVRTYVYIHTYVVRTYVYIHTYVWSMYVQMYMGMFTQIDVHMLSCKQTVQVLGSLCGSEVKRDNKWNQKIPGSLPIKYLGQPLKNGTILGRVMIAFDQLTAKALNA
jgi:hypothetical protein